MNITESIKSAIKQLIGNKGRTLLTMIGMFIGIGAVIMILSLSSGLKTFINDQFATLGVGYYELSCKDDLVEHYITLDDLELIRSFPEVEYALGAVVTDGIVYNDKGEDFDANILAVGPEFGSDIQKMDFRAGRNFTQRDEDARALSVIISDSCAKALFRNRPYDQIVGEQIRLTINKQPNSYQIVGIYESSMSENATQDELEASISWQRIYLPVSTAMQLENNGDCVQAVVGMIYEGYDQDEACSKINQLLNKRHQQKDGYSLYSMSQIVEMVNGVLGIITTFLAVLAGISLVVGGVGIMNIMLVTVKERTKEIGIRKALGASNKAILLQFLIESLMLTLIGGIIGMIIGYVGAILVGNFISIQAEFTLGILLFSTLTSSGIGILFGVYPAYQAALLDPIEALRDE